MNRFLLPLPPPYAVNPAQSKVCPERLATMSRKKSKKAAKAAKRRDRTGDPVLQPTQATAGKATGPAVGNSLRKIGAMPRRSLLKSAAIIGGVLVIGGGIHAFDTNNKQRHDLSVIGEGKPVVVQVHDPSCPSCRQLMRSTETALETMPQIEYRIADLTSKAGQEMASRFGAEKVTLLLFDDRGDHLGTIRGVQSVEDLKAAFQDQFSIEPVSPDA